MAIQRTLSIIKPDATRRNLTGAINQRKIHLKTSQRNLLTKSTNYIQKL